MAIISIRLHAVEHFEDVEGEDDIQPRPWRGGRRQVPDGVNVPSVDRKLAGEFVRSVHEQAVTRPETI